MRRAGALLLALLIAGPALAAEPASLVVETATVTVSRPEGVPKDVPLQVVQVTGGYWVAEAELRARYEESEDLKRQNASLKKSAGSTPLKAVALALVGGALAGYAYAKWRK